MAIIRVIPPGDLKLSPVNPLTGKRSFTLISGPQYVRQKISCRLRFFLGEWFLDQREGVPYYRDVFVKNPDLDLIRSIFRSVILSVQEVASLPQLLLTYDGVNRVLAISFEARLVAGGVLIVRQPDEPFIIRVQRAA